MNGECTALTTNITFALSHITFIDNSSLSNISVKHCSHLADLSYIRRSLSAHLPTVRTPAPALPSHPSMSHFNLRPVSDKDGSSSPSGSTSTASTRTPPPNSIRDSKQLPGLPPPQPLPPTRPRRPLSPSSLRGNHSFPTLFFSSAHYRLLTIISNHRARSHPRSQRTPAKMACSSNRPRTHGSLPASPTC